MVLKNIVFDDVCSVFSLVKFMNSGIFKASHVEELITDAVALTGVLMGPGLTRNLVSNGWLDDKVCSIHTQQGTKRVYNING